MPLQGSVPSAKEPSRVNSQPSLKGQRKVPGEGSISTKTLRINSGWSSQAMGAQWEE